ncbi:hypothetical protein DXM27_19845 [Rhizobium rhizogenes]|uniref:LysR substrate-binding domain-containing protein n=1 Tax=Rhizobium rhizogenes TaxID=359 RepID=A0AA88JQY8_RHIRH|nr:hypothetical protein DXM27_19845 [Rhizobium rhizogenes]
MFLQPACGHAADPPVPRHSARHPDRYAHVQHQHAAGTGFPAASRCRRADHVWSGRGEIDIAELRDQSFVIREAGSMTRQIFERALTESGIQIRHELVLASREAMKEAVANGLGLGIVLDKELGNDQRLVGLRVTGASLAASEYLVAHPEVSELGAVREFIATVAEDRRPSNAQTVMAW